MRQLAFTPTLSGWRTAARFALNQQWPPEEISWQELTDDQSFLDLDEKVGAILPPSPAFKVPKNFGDLAALVACHSDAQRWRLLYGLLWRLTHGEPHLLEIVVDPTVHRLREMEKSVRRDLHKMRAFVRFRSVLQGGTTWYVAWFEPQHRIVELNAPFFVNRFAQMSWSILTPDRCAHWDQKILTFTGGVTRAGAPTEDGVEKLWVEYYANIFNPARVKVKAMQKEMPKKYWQNLPEAAGIADLLRQAPARVDSMMSKSQAKRDKPEEFFPVVVPQTDQLQELRQAALTCKGCPLYRRATQTVFGEGPLVPDLCF